MPYHYNVTLTKKIKKRKKSFFSYNLDRFAAAFRSSLLRAALRELFIDGDASLIDTVPEIRLRRRTQQETLFDRFRNCIEEPIELTFFEKDRLLPFLSWRRSFASALVFAVTFAGFLGLSARDLQAASEQPHNAPQKHTLKGSIEFLPTDCPPVMHLSNCVNSALIKAERSMGQELLAQYSGGTHSNSGEHGDSSDPHADTPAQNEHTNTSHVNLAPARFEV